MVRFSPLVPEAPAENIAKRLQKKHRSLPLVLSFNFTYDLSASEGERADEAPRMEVLLLTDIVGIGKRNDLIVVKSGFALNHLLPNGKALVVTPNVRKRYAEQIKKRALERESEKQLQSSLSAALGGKSITIEAKVSKTGKLYAAISEVVIVDAIKKEHATELAESSVTIGTPIKTLGKHTVELHVGMQTITLGVEIVKEATETAVS